MLSILERKSQIWLFDKFRIVEAIPKRSTSQEDDQFDERFLEKQGQTFHNKINSSFQGNNEKSDSLLKSAPVQIFQKDGSRSVSFPELSFKGNEKFIYSKPYQKEVAKILRK